MRESAVLALAVVLLAAACAPVPADLDTAGPLPGPFDYTEEPVPPLPPVSGWENALLALHLLAAACVVGVRLRGGADPGGTDLVLLLLLVPWGQGGRLVGAAFGRAVLLATALLATRRTGGAGVAVLIAVAALSTAFSPDLASARDGWIEFVGLGVAFLLAAGSSRHDARAPRFLGLAFVASASLAAVVLLAQKGAALAGLSPEAERGGFLSGGSARLAGDFFHPGHIGTFLVAAGIVLAAPALKGRGAPAAGALALLVIGLAQGARASLLAFVAGAAVLAWFAGSPRVRRVLLGSGAAVLVFGAAAVLWRFAGGDVYAWSRVSIWRSAVHAIASRPWSGFGMGAFPTFADAFQYPDPDPASPSRWGLLFLGPHSDVLGLFVNFGVVGGGAILAALAVAVRRAWSWAKAGVWEAGCLAAAAALAAHGLMDDFLLMRPAAGIVFAVLLGTVVGRSGNAEGRPGPRLPKLLLTAIVVPVLIFGAALPWRADRLAREGRPWDAVRFDPFGAGYWARASHAADGPVARRLGLALYAAGRMTEVVPDSADAWWTLAQVHLSALRGPLPTRETAEAALAALDRSLALVPHGVQARRERGRLRAFLGDMEGAEGDFRRALQDEPNFLGARFDLVRLLLQTGDRAATRAEIEDLRLRVERWGSFEPWRNYDRMILRFDEEDRAEMEAWR